MEIPQPNRSHRVQSKMMQRDLLTNEALYVESIGKVDSANIVQDPEATSRGSAVLRLVLGAAEEIPFRALSYIDSAVRVAQFLDVDQLQIIHINEIGNRINGINKNKADEAVICLAHAATEITSISQSRGLSILHATDLPLDTARYEPLASTALEQNPDIAGRLFKKGAKHGGDALAYTAVHFAIQDTDELELKPINSDAPAQISGERTISIGCQQERTFYLARMAMRLANQGDMLERTAQVFTKHVSPPYYFSKGGEPTLLEGMDPMQFGLLEQDAHTRLGRVNDPTAKRDIHHFITLNNQRSTSNE